MDRLEPYRSVVRRLLGEHLEYGQKDTQVETVGIFDDSGGNYLLIEVDWQHPRRIYSVVIHVHLKEEKIWIEQDWTEKGIAQELIEAGVPKEVIKLGFQPPESRASQGRIPVPSLWQAYKGRFLIDRRLSSLTASWR